MPTFPLHEFAQRLGPNWSSLADAIGLNGLERNALVQGREPQEIIFWLERRKELHRLIPALESIGRQDLRPLAEHLAGVQTHLVVLAMNQQEASILEQSLLTSQAGPLYGLKQKMDCAKLSLTGRYGNKREEWRPFGATSPTIQEILDNLITKIGSEVSLNPISDDFLSNEKNEYACKCLERDGGLVVVDFLSMHNEPIRDAYRDSHLMSGSGRIAILALPPHDLKKTELHEHLEASVASKYMKRAFGSFRDLHPSVEFGITNEQALNRWLYLNLKFMKNFFRNQPSDPIATAYAQAFGGVAPRGVGNIVTGAAAP